MDTKIKESKELIKQKQKELEKTTNKREINKINNEIKRIENSMRKRALELERQAYINRYIARKERVIENNRRRIKATGQLFFIDNKELVSSAKPDDVIKMANKLNKELDIYKKRIEDAKSCIKKIRNQNYSDIKGYYEHLQLTEDIKNGKALFPDRLRKKYFGRSFKGVTTYSDTQLVPKDVIPTTKLKEEAERIKKILSASRFEYKEIPENKPTIKPERKEEKIIKQEQEQQEKLPQDIYIYRDYSGISIKELDKNGAPTGQNIMKSISLNWENETDQFDWYKYKPEYKIRILALLKFADNLKRKADPQIVDAIILESFQNTSTDVEIEKAFEKAEFLLDKYNQIVTNPLSSSKVEYNLTNRIDSGIFYTSNKRFKTYYDNCLYQAERAKHYATLTNLDGNSRIKRFFRRIKQIAIGKEPNEEIHIKKIEISKKLLSGIRSDLAYYGSNKDKDGKGNKDKKINEVIIDEIEL